VILFDNLYNQQPLHKCRNRPDKCVDGVSFTNLIILARFCHLHFTYNSKVKEYILAISYNPRLIQGGPKVRIQHSIYYKPCRSLLLISSIKMSAKLSKVLSNMFSVSVMICNDEFQTTTSSVV